VPFANLRALLRAVVLAGGDADSATLIHLADRSVQPDKFGTIADAM
jgi:hypothetical protein